MKQKKPLADWGEKNPVLIPGKDGPQLPELALEMSHVGHSQSQAIFCQKLKVVKDLGRRVCIQAVYAVSNRLLPDPVV